MAKTMLRPSIARNVGEPAGLLRRMVNACSIFLSGTLSSIRISRQAVTLAPHQGLCDTVREAPLQDRPRIHLSQCLRAPATMVDKLGPLVSNRFYTV